MNKHKPRVAIVRHGDYPIQPHLRRDVFALRDAGFDVDVICDLVPGQRHYEKVDGVTVIRVPLQHKRGTIMRYIFEYTAMPLLAAGALTLRSARHRYDYVEIDTMPDWLLAAAIVPKLMGAKVVLYMFENMAELLATDHGLSHKHPLVRTLDGIELVCARVADRILTPYEKARQRLIDQGISDDKIVFIPNGPDEDVFLAGLGGKVPPRRRKKLAEGAIRSFRMVTHGSLLERYGIQTLVEATAQLRDRIPGLTLDIIGTGEYEPVLQAMTTQFGIDDMVTFNGLIPFTEMAAHLVNADAGVVPYWVDGMPNKLMEYFLLGIPAVVGDWPTMRRYFGDDTVTYVKPRSVEALAEAIYGLYTDEPRRRKMAIEARKLYMKTLAWSAAKESYVSIYKTNSRSDDVGQRTRMKAHATTSVNVAEDTDRLAPPFSGEANTADAGANNWLSFVLGQSRGPRNAITRLPTIVNRFGVSSAKSRGHFETLLSVTDRYGVRPTLPVTAVTARRHPKLMSWLQDRGVELAVHGYVHNNFAAMTPERQVSEMERARDELSRMNIPTDGWRSPYSRWNEHTVAALKTAGFKYDATPVYEWPAFDEENIELTSEARTDYERIRALFGVRDAGVRAVLPYTVDGLLRIPMSIPQDEDMVDRLHLSDDDMARVWLRVLADCRAAGETFVMCLHPERAAICSRPLSRTLAYARAAGDVWFATLGEIFDWWQIRNCASVEVSRNGSPNRWQVKAEAPPSVVIRLGQRQLTGTDMIEVDLPIKPVVHAGSQWPDHTLARIREAGYVVDMSPPTGPVAVDLDAVHASDAEPDEVIRSLNGRSEDLVRIQPWPAGYRSSMSVTGDIDAVTLFDFAMRLKEFS